MITPPLAALSIVLRSHPIVQGAIIEISAYLPFFSLYFLTSLRDQFRPQRALNYRFFASPVLAVSFSFNEDLITVHATVPSKSDSFRSFRFFEASLIQLPGLGVIEINGRDRRVLFLKLFARVEDQDGKVLCRLSMRRYTSGDCNIPSG